MSPSRKSHSGRRAFSLIELLTVTAIVATLSMVTIPAVQSLRGAGSVNRAIADLSGTLELARTHAMANRTYVRVLLASVDPAGGRLNPGTVALVVYAADGSTRSADMTDPAAWPMLSRPLVLENLQVADGIQGAGGISTVADATPSGQNVPGELMSAFGRSVPGVGTVQFDQVIQFGPNGEARVGFDQPARHIKLGMSRPDASGPAAANAFALRISGVNGSINVLRDDRISL